MSRGDYRVLFQWGCLLAYKSTSGQKKNCLPDRLLYNRMFVKSLKSWQTLFVDTLLVGSGPSSSDMKGLSLKAAVAAVVGTEHERSQTQIYFEYWIIIGGSCFDLARTHGANNRKVKKNHLKRLLVSLFPIFFYYYLQVNLLPGKPILCVLCQPPLWIMQPGLLLHLNVLDGLRST